MGAIDRGRNLYAVRIQGKEPALHKEEAQIMQDVVTMLDFLILNQLITLSYRVNSREPQCHMMLPSILAYISALSSDHG